MVGNFRRLRRPKRLTPALWGIGLFALSLLGGCSADAPGSLPDGDETSSYKARQKAAETQFAHRQLLEENLIQTVWEQNGISLRVPKPFQRDEKNAVSSKNVLGVNLPDLIGTWTAVLPGGNSKSPQTAYLFVLSHRHQSPDEESFHHGLIKSQLYHLNYPTRKRAIDHEWTSQNLVGNGLPFTSATFEATLANPKIPANFTVFLMQHGRNQRRDQIQVAMLFVVPKACVFAGSQPNADPKTLSAETLHIALPRQDDS